MALNLRRRRFTVEEYRQMARAGILGEDDRIELIEGEIVEMTPSGRRHASCVATLSQHFAETLRSAVLIWPQNPIRLDDHSEPQPDLVLLRPRPDRYASTDPTPADVLLLVEVADTTVESDRRVKVPLYARSGICEVWLIDLQQGMVTVYLDPRRAGYRTARVFHRGEELAPSAFPDSALAVADLLPE